MSLTEKLQKAARFAQNLTAQDINKGIEIGKKAIEKGVNGTISEVNGLLNKNHRHDDPHEKAIDAIRASINSQHRFQSFSEERPGNVVKWHIDGHDYFWAVSELLDSAKEVIFILDWWLSPELYLRRPPARFPQWRLDRVLQRKATEGVKIYVVVYKEVQAAASLGSRYTKDKLHELHSNIAVIRHPDHIGSQDSTRFWSHHEKVVVVDNNRACIGGLDLCYGRWDTKSHPLADVHPTDFSRTLFPGQDYNNARVLDFSEVDKYTSNHVSILETPRMSWHDVHMSISGPSVLDIVQHFVERWNELKTRKHANDLRYDWLALPHDVHAAPQEAVARHPHREKWAAQGRRFKQRFHRGKNYHPYHEELPKTPGTCRVQVVRSVSDWSHGVLKESSIQSAYISLIGQAEHYIYIENQFFISNTGNTGPVQNQIARALLERILRAARAGQKFKVVVVIPEMPGFSGDVKATADLKTILGAQYRTINRGGKSIYEEISRAGYEPKDYIRFYHLRSYDRINAPTMTLIAQMESHSGVTFHEAQVALARLWIGPTGPTAGRIPSKVYIKEPDPVGADGLEVANTMPSTPGSAASDSTASGLTSPESTTPSTSSLGFLKSTPSSLSVKTTAQNKGKQKIVEVEMPADPEEARKIVDRFEKAAPRSDISVSDSIAQHSLRDKTRLVDELWLGTPEEEKDAFVSEQLYIHSKLMIVDDRRVIMGSANINDRSQKGNGDSEIALVVEDQDLVPATMNGRPYQVARFAATLRRKLYREHLGMISPELSQTGMERVTTFMRPAPWPNADEIGTAEDQLVSDPLLPQLEEMWNAVAKRNTSIFVELFRPVPTDLVWNWDQYKNYIVEKKHGHVVPDIPLERIKQKLSEVRGHLVEMPLDFLKEQKEIVEGPDWLGLNPTLQIFI